MGVPWDKRVPTSDRWLHEYNLRIYNKDTVVKCFKCGKVVYVNMADSLKHGWTTCCRLTATLVFSKADIESEVGVLMDRAFISAVKEGAKSK